MVVVGGSVVSSVAASDWGAAAGAVGDGVLADGSAADPPNTSWVRVNQVRAATATIVAMVKGAVWRAKGLFDGCNGSTMQAALYRRADNRWAFRIKASNGQIVATDGGQGYESKPDARDTLVEVMGGEYDGPIEEV